MSWPDGEHYSYPLRSLVFSLLLSLVSTLVFSQTEGVLPHLSFSTRRFPRFSLKNLCSLVTLNVFSLAFAATDTTYCIALIPIEVEESRIFLAASGGIYLALHCRATDSLGCSLFGDSLSLCDHWSWLWGVARFLGLHRLPLCFHPSEGVR